MDKRGEEGRKHSRAKGNLHRIVFGLDIKAFGLESLDDGVTRMEPFHSLYNDNNDK